MGFPGGTLVKNLPANAGDARDGGLILVLRRSLGVGNGNPLQDSCLENFMDGGAWWASVHRVAKSRMWLSDRAYIHTYSIYSSICMCWYTFPIFGIQENVYFCFRLTFAFMPFKSLYSLLFLFDLLLLDVSEIFVFVLYQLMRVCVCVCVC